MSQLQDYQNKYDNIIFERRNGVLLVRLHTGGGPLKWGFKDSNSVHGALGNAFYDISQDRENKVVILTGTGDVFLEDMDPQQSTSAVTFDLWDRLYKEGKSLLANLLDIEVPVIGVLNGPATGHAELILMSDVVIASDDAHVADLMHFPAGGVPGDGSQVVWQMLLGPNRGRAFMLMGQKIAAQEALSLGLVAEVLPRDQLLPRAWAIAEDIASKPALSLRYTRVCLTQHMKQRLLDELGYGLAVEGLAILSTTT